MRILNLDEIKNSYKNKSSAEAKLIIELATALNDEIEAGSRAKEGVKHYCQLLDREKSIVDRLLSNNAAVNCLGSR